LRGEIDAAVDEVARPLVRAVVGKRRPVGELAGPAGSGDVALDGAVIASLDERPRPGDLVAGPGDDVDHARERVGAVEGRTRSADHLDAIDVLDADVDQGPERSPE